MLKQTGYKCPQRKRFKKFRNCPLQQSRENLLNKQYKDTEITALPLTVYNANKKGEMSNLITFNSCSSHTKMPHLASDPACQASHPDLLISLNLR